MAELFIPAKHFTPTNGRDIDLIVIHDMEAPEGPRTAENVAEYFRKGERRASCHWCFDENSAVRSVADEDVAYHAPGANHNGLGYEHAGYARQTRAEWLDRASTDCLRISARQAAKDCKKYKIPIKFVNANTLRAGNARGITTHHEVSQAFRRSDHWDPGPNFPMDKYLLWVFEINGSVPTTNEEEELVGAKEDIIKEVNASIYKAIAALQKNRGPVILVSKSKKIALFPVGNEWKQFPSVAAKKDAEKIWPTIEDQDRLMLWFRPDLKGKL
jgi:hypothetical protein